MLPIIAFLCVLLVSVWAYYNPPETSVNGRSQVISACQKADGRVGSTVLMPNGEIEISCFVKDR